LSELNILLAALIVIFPMQTLQISAKSTAKFLSNSCFKNGTQKHLALNKKVEKPLASTAQ